MLVTAPVPACFVSACLIPACLISALFISAIGVSAQDSNPAAVKDSTPRMMVKESTPRMMVQDSTPRMMIQDSTPRGPVYDSSVYLRAAALRRAADSLQNAWRVQWKQSDSMRVASMLLRMRSDSLKRVATSLIASHRTDSVIGVDSLREVSLRRLYDVALKSLRSKSAGALTASDSLTAVVMVTEPDTGSASFYAHAFHGKKTSSGEVYNMNDKTCAHRWLPFGTRVRVRNLSNGKETIVRVNDRGPFKHGRIIDLSKAAAQDIDMIRAGTSRVELLVGKTGDAVPLPPSEDP